ncbi:MAG: sensor domain-containing diguanylate cyclase [Desulfovibrionales bacterium]
MNTQSSTPTILFLKTEALFREQILSALPADSIVKILNPGLSSLEKNLEPDSPSVLIAPFEEWEKMDSEQHFLVDENQVQLALITRQGQAISSNLSVPSSFLGFIRTPVDQNELNRLIQKAVQVHDLYSDIYYMTREIALERELLARKSSQLTFINRILTKAAQTLNIREIMSLADTEFKKLLNNKCTMGIFWNSSEKLMEASLYLPRFSKSEEETKWISHLLEAAQKITNINVRDYQTGYFSQNSVNLSYPQPGNIIMIPLKCGEEHFGVILLIADDARDLGRDQIQIIHNAGNHLGLAARNALKYEKVRIQADHDGLTKIFNRHHFDVRLKEEIKRHQRHASTLSLLMLDLDYFKNINDKYGHQAGDLALKKIGEILQNTLRETDFPARYGGEEFAVILPETTENQAWFLAHRLRKKIANLRLKYQGHTIRLTVSIGITSMEPGSLSPAADLIEHADRALYLAKNSGRNMVCTSRAAGIKEAMAD